MTMNITTSLKEGMKIMPIEAHDKKETTPEYTLIIDKADGEMYGFYNKDIIKLSEINEDDYICTGLDAFEERREYLEVKISEEKTELLDHRDITLSAIEDAIDNNSYCSSESGWVEIEVRKVETTREEYWKRLRGEGCIEFSLRDKIKNFYDGAEDIGNGVRRVA